MLLVLYGSDLLLLGSLVMACPHHLDDVEAEAQCDKTEDKGKEQLLVAVGKGLHISGKPVKTGGLGELAPCRDHPPVRAADASIFFGMYAYPPSERFRSRLEYVLIDRVEDAPRILALKKISSDGPSVIVMEETFSSMKRLMSTCPF